MKKILVLVLALFTGYVYGQFEVHQMDEWGNRLGQTSMVINDGDGKSYIYVGKAKLNGGEVVRYEFHNPETWTRHNVGIGNTDVGGVAYDFTGDGFSDFWAGKNLHVNNKNGTFTTYNVGTIITHDNIIADINGDGKMDGVANWDQYGLVWYDIPENPTQPWTEHMIESASSNKIHGGIAPFGAMDIDGDNDVDIVTARSWYENVDGTRWIRRDNLHLGENWQYGIAVRTTIQDMNNDGFPDIVQSECDNPDGRIGIYYNNGCGHYEYQQVQGKGLGQDWHGHLVADFDDDGEMEIIAGGGPLGNNSPNVYGWDSNGTTTWIRTLIASGRQLHEAVSGDIDGDGDVDFYGKDWADGFDKPGPGIHTFYENKLYDGNTPVPPDTGWVALFNGQDLDGWFQTGGAQNWYVQDGVIVGEAVQGVTQNGFLTSEKQYADFHMKGKVNLVNQALNSGVMFRSYVAQVPTSIFVRNSWMGYPVNLPAGRMYGYQMEVADEATGYIWDEARRGEVSEFWPGTDNGNFVIGQWNDFEIICEGPNVTTKINGVERISINDGMGLNGHFGLQVHGRSAGGLKVMWKDLFIKGKPLGEACPECPECPEDTIPEPPIEEGIIHEWGFNNNGNDEVGGVALTPSGATKYYDSPAPEGTHYGFGQYGGWWDSQKEVVMPDQFWISFIVKPRGRPGSNEVPKTIFDMDGIRMLVVMGSVESQPDKGKVAMQVWDHSQADEERGFESYGNVLTANQWNHVVVKYKTGSDMFDNSMNAIYVNGRKVTTMNYSKMAYTWDRESVIKVGKMFSGKYPIWSPVDALIIGSGPISDQEVVELYNSYE